MPERKKIFHGYLFKIDYLPATGRVIEEHFASVYVANPLSSEEMSLEECCKRHPLYIHEAVLTARATGREVQVTF